MCQGYSTAFYRLCLASGIDTRVITRLNSSENHAWNIVRLGGQYYEVDATWDHDHYRETYLYFLKGSSYWLTTTHYTLGDEFSDSAFSARYSLPDYDYVSYDTPALEGGVKGLDDIVASISAQHADDNIERFRIAIAVDAAESVLGGIFTYEPYPRIAAYNAESIIAQQNIENNLTVDDPVFSIDLPVPGAWGERQAVYTLSREGYDDVSDRVNIYADGDACIAQIYDLPHLGRLTLALMCNVSFDAGNGLPTETVSVQAGKPLEKPAEPTRKGCLFEAWFEAGAETPFDFENTLVAGDCTLSARWIEPDLALPDALVTIGDEAFVGGAFRFVKLSERTTTIGRRAFADCPNLTCICIPEGILSIEPDAFDGVSGLTVLGKAGSATEQFAEDMHFHFIADS